MVTKTQKALEESKKLIGYRTKAAGIVKQHGAKLAALDNSTELLSTYHKTVKKHDSKSHKNSALIIKEILKDCDSLERSLKAQLVVLNDIRNQAVLAHNHHAEASK